MLSPRVTIITPVYNGARTIRKSIDSVLQQTESSWEQIIVDDGSVDDTAAIVQSYADPRVCCLRQPNEGRSAARNRALDLAQGEFVLFLDADDWLLPNALESHLTFLSAHPEYGVSVADGYFCTDEGTPIVSLSERRGLVESGNVLARIVVDAGLIGAPVAAMARRMNVERHRLRFEPGLTIGEDWLFFIELARYTAFGFAREVTCGYRWHQGGTTLSADEEFRKEQLWKGRRKVMESPYFKGLPADTRESFFYGLLMDLLRGKPDEQARAIRSPAFRDLPVRIQGRLLRWIGVDCLLRGESADAVLHWLKTARRLSPLDVKTLLVTFIAELNPTLARHVLQARRRGRDTDPLSPFGLALAQGRQS